MPQIAKRQGVVNPENTFYSVKRFIGRRMDEVDEESKARSRAPRVAGRAAVQAPTETPAAGAARC